MNAFAQRDAFDRITEDDAFQASELLLACIFNDNALLDECGLEPEDFAEGVHQTAFREAIDLRRNGQHVNSVSLKPFMPKLVKSERCGDVTPAKYLSNLMILGADPMGPP